MVAGTLEKHERGRVTDVIDLVFRREEGGAVEEVNRARARDVDWYCGDCCTVIVKGRFAD